MIPHLCINDSILVFNLTLLDLILFCVSRVRVVNGVGKCVRQCVCESISVLRECIYCRSKRHVN